MLTHLCGAHANPGGHALQTIGSLAKRIAPTPEELGSQTPKLTPPESNSPATGAARTLPAVASRPIGMQRGVVTSTATPPPSLPAALAASNPDATDRSLEASLTLLIGSRPVPIWQDRATDAGWDGAVMGFRFPAMSEATLARATALVESSLTPMTPSECIDLLVAMKLLTKARPEQAKDQEAQLVIYGRKLAEYPADVVRKVLTTQPDVLTWWPAWAELKERLDLHSRRRRRLLESLRTGKSSLNSSAAPKPAANKLTGKRKGHDQACDR